MDPSQPKSSEFDTVELGAPLLEKLQLRFRWELIPTTVEKLPEPSEEFCSMFPRPLEGISRLQQYYNDSFIIRDNFSTHGERKTFFRDTLGPRAGTWLKEHSKLSANNWYACLNHITEIEGALRRKQVNFPELNVGEVEAAGRGYNTEMSFEQRVAYVAQVDSLIFRFFTQLSEIS